MFGPVMLVALLDAAKEMAEKLGVELLSADLDFKPAMRPSPKQCDRLLCYLREHGEATSITIRDAIGICASRENFDLRWSHRHQNDARRGN